MKLLLILPLLLTACATQAPRPIKTKSEHLCRDMGEVNKATLELLNSQGWLYQGPLYNDGINCTVTLWYCYDSGASCAK